MKSTYLPIRALRNWLPLVLFAIAFWFAVPSAYGQSTPARPDFVAGEVLIQFRAGTTAAQHQNARARAAAVRAETIRAAGAGKGDLELAVLRGAFNVPAAIVALQADPNVLFAEPNWIYTHQSTPDDPYYANGSLWGMYGDASSPANQYGSQAGEAWMAGNTGSNAVYVGVIDEGIQYDHPDLSANVWNNPFDAPDGIDNDGNGYVDDVRGWDFANNDNTIYDGGTRGSLDNHGTHVSGTIGGVGNNGKGVAGVNWSVTLISAKFLGRNGGTTANAVKAVDYLTNLKTQHGLNIVASNNSWGGGGYSQALYDAIQRAESADILFIAAAGNNGTNNDTSASYPSNYDLSNVIAVAAIDSNGGLASFSQYGATTVDLGAPGVGINSTLAYNAYGSYSGTSMATPHVTGAAALYAATYPGTSAAAIKAAILNSATATASLAGKCVTDGRLNVGAMLSLGVTPTPTPTPTATPTSGSIEGTVTSATSGAVIKDATVTIANTSLTTTTDEYGKYRIEAVPVGTYSVTAAANGYVTRTITNVEVAAQTTTTANFVLDTAPPPPAPGAMYVSNITWQKQGGSLLTTVTVRWDSNKNGVAETADDVVPNATVSLNLEGPNGGFWTTTGITNSSGYVAFKLMKAPLGIYKATVTNLQHNTFLWNPTLDGNNNPSFYELK